MLAASRAAARREEGRSLPREAAGARALRAPGMAERGRAVRGGWVRGGGGAAAIPGGWGASRGASLPGAMPVGPSLALPLG